MALPTRTTSNTATEHVADHNTLHGFFNDWESTDPADLESRLAAVEAYEAGDVDAEPQGTVEAHEGANEPHTYYQHCLRWTGSAYPTRPTTLASVLYEGVTAPNGTNSPGGPDTNDIWRNTTVA